MSDLVLSAAGDTDAALTALTGDAVVTRLIRTGLFIVGGLTLFLVGGGAIAKLDSAVMSFGVVQAEGNHKVVEQPDGGVVSAILVKEGDLVRQGQVVMRLDASQANAGLAIEQTAVDTLMATVARLEAEATGAKAVTYPQALTSRAADPAVAATVAGQNELFVARRSALSGLSGTVIEQIKQERALADGYRGQITAVDQQAAMINDELAGLKKLYDQGYATKSQLLSTERASAALEGQKREYQANLDRIGHSVSQYTDQDSQLTRDRQSTVTEQLDDARGKLADAIQRRNAAQAVVDHTTVRAPVTGYVFGLTANTIGAVVGRGEKLLEVLPKDASPIIEARVKPGDGAHVRKGMKVQLRLTSAQGRGQPALHGVVQNRSVDLMSDAKTGATYYQLTVAIDHDDVARPGAPSLDVGTPVEVIVPTGSRTALAYMFEPLMESFRHGLKEQ
jgi:HlyD family type I secretion membrane fusion protein